MIKPSSFTFLLLISSQVLNYEILTFLLVLRPIFFQILHFLRVSQFLPQVDCN